MLNNTPYSILKKDPSTHNLKEVKDNVKNLLKNKELVKNLFSFQTKHSFH